jgi:hypothetical protein
MVKKFELEILGNLQKGHGVLRCDKSSKMKERGCKITLNSRRSSKTKKKKGGYSKFEDSKNLNNMKKNV